MEESPEHNSETESEESLEKPSTAYYSQPITNVDDSGSRMSDDSESSSSEEEATSPFPSQPVKKGANKVDANDYASATESDEDTHDKKAKSITPKEKAKTSSEKKTTDSAKKKQSSPSKKKGLTYVEMIHQAIVALNDRSGSSNIAISKWMIQNFPHLNDVSIQQFKRSLANGLKTGIKAGRFLKVRASFKMNSAWVKKEKQKVRAKEAARKLKERKRLAELKKAREKKLKETDEEREKQEAARVAEALRKQRQREEQERIENEKNMTPAERAALEAKRAAEREAERLKEEAAARAREIAERIRKRRFPMEDTALMAEDKELGVRPPSHVTRRPNLPVAFMCTIPIDRRPQGRTPMALYNASCGTQLDFGGRGIVSDLLQIFGFFRGDVGYAVNIKTDIIPEFTLKHLFCAVDEFINGNVRQCKLIPPLITHLFVVCLRELLSLPDNMDALSRQEKKMREDLHKLLDALSPVSWPEVCRHYMDVMERVYTSSMSADPNVLPGGTIDMTYSDENVSNDILSSNDVPAPLPDDAESAVLPAGYLGYLGHPMGVLARAHDKLSRSDPWQLSAEELMSLLRTLTDDIMASRPEIGVEIEARGDELYELLKAKRIADTNFRKTKLAFEGPKQPPKPSAKKGDSKEASEKEEASEKADGGSNEPEAAPTFKPTATKKEFENAEKARAKAHDAYEKGLRKLVSRSEPVGYDKFNNPVYYFVHDPDVLYIEVKKKTSSSESSLNDSIRTPDRVWSIVESKSMFDSFLSSLDVRGTRESNLLESLSNGTYRRNLYDENKEKSALVARKREIEELERKIENARIACAAEQESGRRSGRLASNAQLELSRLEQELSFASETAKAEAAPKPVSHFTLTGLEALAKYDSEFSSLIPCSQLVQKDDIAGSGVLGSLVYSILDLESLCNELAQWESDEISRKSWIDTLKDAVEAWNAANPVIIGPAIENPSEDVSNGDDLRSSDKRTPDHGITSDAKRRKTSPNGSGIQISDGRPNVVQLLSALKTPLLQLEERVYSITGLQMASDAADEAEENVSTISDPENDDQNTKENGPERKREIRDAWKKKIFSLQSIPTKRAGIIRDRLVAAITAARKAHLSDVVAELRSILLLHRPCAAGEAKMAALAFLEKSGGYQPSAEEEEEEEVPENDNEESAGSGAMDEEVPSLLCGEAMMLGGSLDGYEDADRVDWRDAVKGCRTLSRYAALAHAFIVKARHFLRKMEIDRSTLYAALKHWEAEETNPKAKTRGSRQKGKGANKKKGAKYYGSESEIWDFTRLTDKFVLGKVEGYPWWPARVCDPVDNETASALAACGRCLISFVGDKHLHAVSEEFEIRPYYEQKLTDEDASAYDKQTLKYLDDSIKMAKRIRRGRGMTSGRSLRGTFVEEKKSAI